MLKGTKKKWTNFHRSWIFQATNLVLKRGFQHGPWTCNQFQAENQLKASQVNTHSNPGPCRGTGTCPPFSAVSSLFITRGVLSECDTQNCHPSSAQGHRVHYSLSCHLWKVLALKIVFNYLRRGYKSYRQVIVNRAGNEKAHRLCPLFLLSPLCVPPRQTPCLFSAAFLLQMCGRRTQWPVTQIHILCPFPREVHMHACQTTCAELLSSENKITILIYNPTMFTLFSLLLI